MITNEDYKLYLLNMPFFVRNFSASWNKQQYHKAKYCDTACAYSMNAQESVEFGICDEVVENIFRRASA